MHKGNKRDLCKNMSYVNINLACQGCSDAFAKIIQSSELCVFV